LFKVDVGLGALILPSSLSCIWRRRSGRALNNLSTNYLRNKCWSTAKWSGSKPSSEKTGITPITLR